MHEIELVVFDLAGTTVQDDGQVPEAFTAALAEHGVSVGPEEIRGLRGASKREAILRLLPPGAARGRTGGVGLRLLSRSPGPPVQRHRPGGPGRVRDVRVSPRSRHPGGPEYRIRSRHHADAPGGAGLDGGDGGCRRLRRRGAAGAPGPVPDLSLHGGDRSHQRGPRRQRRRHGARSAGPDTMPGCGSTSGYCRARTAGTCWPRNLTRT